MIQVVIQDGVETVITQYMLFFTDIYHIASLDTLKLLDNQGVSVGIKIKSAALMIGVSCII